MSTTLEHPGVEISPWVRERVRGPQRMLIDGDLVDAADGSTFATVDPATGGVITDVPMAGEVDVDAAVAAARRAVDGPWGLTTPRDRERLLLALAQRLEDRADEMAELEALDQGKPKAHARLADIQFAIDHLRYFAGWPTKLQGEVPPLGRSDAMCHVRREPVGVVGAIVPWNFPIMLAAWKIAPALAAGCSVVLKPAEETPLTTLRLAEMALEVGFPPGALNVVTGPGETTGRAIVRHPEVDTIAFTGSVSVGREVARDAAATLKQVFLELGGKNPLVVFADADVEAVVGATIQAAFFNAGQVCSSASRLMIEAPLHDAVVETLSGIVPGLPVGPGLMPETVVGPLVSREQFARVTGYLERGLAGGATARIGGGPAPDAGEGFFVAPTILTGASDDMECTQDEIFGPVLVAQSFESEEELVRRANASNFGLTAGIWTSDLARAQRVAARLRVGTVWTNSWFEFDPAVPFGGYRGSGYGRDGGRSAIEKFTQEKAVWTRLS